MITQATQKVIQTLQKNSLSIQDRNALINAVLKELHVLPLHDSIVITPAGITINGKPLETDEMISFRDSAMALKDNWAWRVIKEQIRYLATNLGIYKSVSLDELYFYKSALWNIAEVDKILDQII